MIVEGRERKNSDEEDLPKNARELLPASYCVIENWRNNLTELKPKDGFTVIPSSGI